MCNVQTSQLLIEVSHLGKGTVSVCVYQLFMNHCSQKLLFVEIFRVTVCILVSLASTTSSAATAHARVRVTGCNCFDVMPRHYPGQTTHAGSYPLPGTSPPG